MTAFTPEQEARIREIVAEEKRALTIRVVPCDQSFESVLGPAIQPSSKILPRNGGSIE